MTVIYCILGLAIYFWFVIFISAFLKFGNREIKCKK